jgi:hypothetical protein
MGENTMVLRVVLFQLRAEVTDYDSRMLLASIGGAVKSVPGLLSFNVGRRIEGDGGYTLGDAAAGAATVPYDYAAVFQFESAKALQAYLHHPAQSEIRSRFAAVVSAALTSDYEM